MLMRIDHVAYVVRDLAAGIDVLGTPYGLQLAVELQLPEFSLRAAFLSGGQATLELIEFTDPAIVRQRLGDDQLRLDHVGYLVDDIDAAAATLRATGARFCTPHGAPLDAPIEIGGARHLWTVPAEAPGTCLQLVERADVD
jgi:catechol 2,3-dioxygenase-like lactoylglutathione lyase family enzyme